MIAFIAPYLGLKRTADAVIEKNSFPVATYLGNLNEGLQVAEKLEASGSRSIFISRGGTAKVIRENLFSQVIEIKVSPFDLLKILTPYIKQPGKRIGIVGFNSLLEPARSVCSILELDVKYYQIHDENEVFSKIDEIRKDHINVIVGDVISVKIAQKYDLFYHLIESTEESVKDAIEKAISLMSNIQLELEKLARSRAVFDSVKDGIISVDRYMKIDQFNAQAREFLLGKVSDGKTERAIHT